MPADDTAETFKVWATDNMVYGPVDLPTLALWVAEKRVLADTWLHCQADNAWRQAREIPSLRPHFGLDGTSTRTDWRRAADQAVDPEELRQFPMFAALSNQEIQQFLHFAHLYQAAPEQLIIRKGDPGDAVYFVLAGEVRVRLIVGLEDRTLSRIPAGEFFGEMAMFTQSARSADVVTENGARLLKLTAQAFQLLIQEIPQLASPILLAMAREMAQRINEANVRFQREVSAEFLWH
jgi:CRP-like cAMP-binding protein